MIREKLRYYLEHNARHTTRTYEPPAPMLNPESYTAQMIVRRNIEFNPILLQQLLEEIGRNEDLKIFDGGAIAIGSIGFSVNPEKLAEWLIVESLTDGPDQALDRLQSFLQLDYAPAYEVLALCGVTINRQIELYEGIRLVPFSDVPRSAVTDWLTGTPTWIVSGLGRAGRSIRPEAALIADVQQRPKIFAGLDELSRSTQRVTKLPQMEKIAMCLSVVGPCAPTAVAHWTHLRDDVPLAWEGEGWAEPRNELLPRESVDLSQVSDKIKNVIELYMRLSSTMQDQLFVPLSRLNKSGKRLDPIDRAIELRIALESLLAKDLDENAPVGFSLRLRGAFFLGRVAGERLRIYNLLKDVYTIASIAVHDGHFDRKTQEKAPSILNEATQLCADLILQIMERGHFPDWTSLILG